MDGGWHHHLEFCPFSWSWICGSDLGEEESGNCDTKDQRPLRSNERTWEAQETKRWLAPSVLLIPVKWNLQIQSWFKWKAWVWASCGVRWSWDDSVSSQWASERFIHLLLLSVRSCRSPSCLWPHPPSCMCVCLCVTGQREGKKRSGRAREASSLSHDRTWCEQLVSLKSKALLQTT